MRPDEQLELHSGQHLGQQEWPRQARPDAGQALFAPGTVTVPLRSGRKASSFWIILLLVSG
jgi:hypothetical protein